MLRNGLFTVQAVKKRSNKVTRTVQSQRIECRGVWYRCIYFGPQSFQETSRQGKNISDQTRAVQEGDEEDSRSWPSAIKNIDILL